MKTFASLTSARAAIKKAGLSGMIVRYDDVFGSFVGAKKHQPVVLCDNAADRREVEERGFKAELKRTKIEAGATVSLRPDYLETDSGYALVKAMLDDEIEGGVFLDRPLGGTRYWNVEDLFLVAPVTGDA